MNYIQKSLRCFLIIALSIILIMEISSCFLVPFKINNNETIALGYLIILLICILRKGKFFLLFFSLLTFSYILYYMLGFMVSANSPFDYTFYSYRAIENGCSSGACQSFSNFIYFLPRVIWICSLIYLAISLIINIVKKN